MAELRERNTSKKTGGKKNASPGKNSRVKGKGSRQPQEQDMGFMRAEVIIICSFAVAVLLFLSNFKLCGAVGQVLRSF